MLKNGTIFFVLLVSLLVPVRSHLSAKSPDAVATVNGVPITTELFEKRMSRLTQERQGNFESIETRRELLDILVAREVLNQEGRRRGFDKSKEVLERIEERITELVINEMVNSIAREKVTDGAMKLFYGKNKDDFREVRAKHILVKTEDEAKAAKKRLDEGADFAVVAKELSIDQASASNGGDLGFFSRERMVKPFSDAAFALKENEISEPVKSDFGYHVIQLIEKKEAAAFETLSPAYLQNLRGQMINFEIDHLKAGASVLVNEKQLRGAASPSHGHPEKGRAEEGQASHSH